MKRNNSDTVFYVNSTSWRVPTILGLVLFILSMILEHHFLLVHYYLLLAGLISYFFTFRKYALLTDDYLVLFFDTFTKKVVVFDINEIESVSPNKIKYDSFMGGARHVYHIDTIVINCHNPIDLSDAKKTLGKRYKNILSRKAEITEDGTGMILYRPPKGGFHHFLKGISESINVTNFENIDKKNNFG